MRTPDGAVVSPMLDADDEAYVDVEIEGEPTTLPYDHAWLSGRFTPDEARQLASVLTHAANQAETTAESHTEEGVSR